MPTAAAELRDIRGPIHIPYPWLLPLAVVIGAIALGLIGAFLLRRWNARHQRSGPPPKTPTELVYERLRAARRWIDADDAKQFSLAASEAVRLYIEARFVPRAARQTTEEFLAALVRQDGSALASHTTLLRDFLDHCDLVKFARYPLSRAEMDAMYASAIRFVEETAKAQSTDATR